MTPESAITKMMYLLGKYEDTKLVKIGLIKNLAGELTKQYIFYIEIKKYRKKIKK